MIFGRWNHSKMLKIQFILNFQKLFCILRVSCLTDSYGFRIHLFSHPRSSNLILARSQLCNYILLPSFWRHDCLKMLNFIYCGFSKLSCPKSFLFQKQSLVRFLTMNLLRVLVSKYFLEILLWVIYRWALVSPFLDPKSSELIMIWALRCVESCSTISTTNFHHQLNHSLSFHGLFNTHFKHTSSGQMFHGQKTVIGSLTFDNLDL